LYYLATSFTDFWRRINIYWKDFIMKYVYYPSFLRLRRRGVVFGVVVSITAVFVMTWLLHSYQSFWLRGTFPVTATDLLFWFIISSFLLLHVLKETKQGRSRVLVQQKRWSLKRGLSAVGLFAVVSVLWGLWDSQSIGEFVSLFHVAGRVTLGEGLVILSLIAVYVGIAGFPWGVQTLAEREHRTILPVYRRPGIQTTALIGVLLLAGSPPTQAFLSPDQRYFLHVLQTDAMNRHDADNLQRGYYEQLIDAKRSNTERWQEQTRPEDWARLPQTPVYRRLSTLLKGELVADTQMMFKGALLTTNRWGMRDRNYALDKPAGVKRLALLGPSDVMGEGVETMATFENVLEDRINARQGPEDQAVEILNFGVSSYTLLQQLVLVEDRVWRFDPDLLVLTYHPAVELGATFRSLARSILAGVPIQDSSLLDIIRRADVQSHDSEVTAYRKLRPYAAELAESVFRRISQAARSRGVPAILLLLDLPDERSRPRDWVLTAAVRHGFQIADIRDVFTGTDAQSIGLAEWDKHPNAEGHRRLAQRFGEELARLDSSFSWDPVDPAPSALREKQ
jgi:hypothetical protein